MPPSFPQTFLWGAATSAYQIEGSPLADGAGPSIWHRFSHTPGRILDGATGDSACDHYHRWAQDLALMRSLGLEAYRFSVAWARVLPEGVGRVNPQGLGFYERLVDALLDHGIEPVLTLYHWDLPAALQDRGGWVNRDSARWFGDYAELMYRSLGDRVRRWITLNEPWVVVDAGYVHGVHAPGHRDLTEAAAAAHHLLLAHGEAVSRFRACLEGQIGIAVNLEPKHPASPSPADQGAARRSDIYMNRQFIEPVMRGRYPAGLEGVYGAAWRARPAEDMRLIGAPIDFLGINYYTAARVRADPAAPLLGASPVPDPQARHTEMGWAVCPQGLHEILCRIDREYGPVPILITENGAAFADVPGPDGAVEDAERVEYLYHHLLAAHRALEDGVDLQGYFVWSLLDNFEWSYGYTRRFGIVRVDWATQIRHPKRSAHWYAALIRSRGAMLSSPP